MPAGDPDAGRLHHLIGSVASGVDVLVDASGDGLPAPPEGYSGGVRRWGVTSASRKKSKDDFPPPGAYAAQAIVRRLVLKNSGSRKSVFASPAPENFAKYKRIFS